MKKLFYHHYESGVVADSEMFVACQLETNSGYVEVAGVEKNKSSGYAYFCFDAYAGESAAEDSGKFAEYLDMNSNEGYSVAWFDNLSDVENDEPDNLLLAEAVRFAKTA